MGKQDEIQMYAQPIDKAAQQMELCLARYHLLVFLLPGKVASESSYLYFLSRFMQNREIEPN